MIEGSRFELIDNAAHLPCVEQPQVYARILGDGLHTRMYFDDEEAANAVDPLLARIEHRQRVDTLIANGEGEGVFRFDIHLQGEHETVFFDM